TSPPARSPLSLHDALPIFALDAGGLPQPLLDAAGLGAARGRGVVIEDVEGRFHARDGRLAGEHPWVPADEIAVAVVLHPERALRSEEHTSELQSPCNLVCR